MATTLRDSKPVIATVSGVQAHPEGEMDALLLGRTRRRQKLRTSDKFKDVFLVKDKTPLQLKSYRGARQELQTRRAVPNDVPKVVKARGPEN
ncbi:hypothetical protein Trydic_g19686 [Trypoxylus dichotomus]